MSKKNNFSDLAYIGLLAKFEEAFSKAIRGNRIIKISDWFATVDRKSKKGIVIRVDVYSHAGGTQRDDLHDKHNKAFLRGIEKLTYNGEEGSSTVFTIFDSLDRCENSYSLYYKVNT